MNMKTVVYQRNNKAPGYFAMKGMLNVGRRFILTLKNADGDLVVPGNRAVTALDHPKTNHKDLLYETWAVAVNERDGVRRRRQSHLNRHTTVPPGLARPTRFQAHLGRWDAQSSWRNSWRWAVTMH